MSSLPLLLMLVAAAPAEPGAFELLADCRRAYQTLDAYADSGEIAVETGGGGEARFRFETRYRPDRWSYVLERLGAESPDVIGPPALWAVWRDGGGTFLYDGRTDAYHPVASAGAGLTEMLGPERRYAALVAIQLLDGEDLLSSALAASVVGPTDCGARRCWTVDLQPDGAGPALRLHLDAESHLVRGVELTVDPIQALAAGGDVAGALLEARRRPRHDRSATRIVVRYETAADMARAAAAPYALPTTARPEPQPVTGGAAATDRVPEAAALEIGTPALGTGTSDLETGRTDVNGRVFAEEIEVRLSTITVRVIDASGTVIPGLGVADFALRVDGELARVESVDWISPTGDSFSQQQLAELARSGVTVPSPGRLVVLFVQTDLHPSRAPGHLRLLPEIKKLLATLHSEDQVAVVSFDSHLKLRQDFTRDAGLLEAAVFRGVRVGREPVVDPGRFPSLARHFDFEAARRAATPERGLRVVADALLPLPGEKIMVFAGWGLGNYFAGGVHMTPEYGETREALARARVTVFVLDITRADYHSLEVGLETIAEDTGGTYEKTFRQPSQMTQRLARTLEGYYTIGFSAPSGVGGRGKVKVELVGRRGQVLLRPTRIGG